MPCSPVSMVFRDVRNRSKTLVFAGRNAQNRRFRTAHIASWRGGTSAPTRIQPKARPNHLYFPAFNFAQRFFAPAIILAFASGLITLVAFFAAGATAATGAATEPALPFFLAHRALWAALILALVASLKIRVGCFGAAGAALTTAFTGATPFFFAHLACCDAFILALVAALKVRRPLVVVVAGAGDAGAAGEGTATEPSPPST